MMISGEQSWSPKPKSGWSSVDSQPYPRGKHTVLQKSRPFLSLPSFRTQLPFPLALGVANTTLRRHFTPLHLQTQSQVAHFVASTLIERL